MEIGEKFIHKFNPTITCEIAAFTENGYRVQQTEGKKKPKQAFYYKADFEVKNGFWGKQSKAETKLEKQNEKLKYPTFKEFLVKVGSLEDQNGSKGFSIMMENEYGSNTIYPFTSPFDLDGIRVQIFFDKFEFENCKIEMLGYTKKIKWSGEFPHVIDEAMYWIYKNYFLHGKEELAGYNVFDKGFYDSQSQFFPRDDQFIGYFNALNYESLLSHLKQKGIDLKSVMIEKVQYDYRRLKGELINLEL